MWSFEILPAKCAPFMTYVSNVPSAAATSGAIVEWNSQRVFKFPWSADQSTLGPYDITVTAHTYEDTSLTTPANVWTRTVTFSDPCPLTVLTLDNSDVDYVQNSGTMTTSMHDRYTTDPAGCKTYVTSLSDFTFSDTMAALNAA